MSENLDKIDHIIVLMMENRSFDHMLGYLSLENGRTDVDGLQSDMSNSHEGRTYPIRHLPREAFNNLLLDPSHTRDAVAEQLANNNSGFVKNFARKLIPGLDHSLIMGYYTAADLPVYDHLARHFCICDRWFCSVPASTWPNRLYSVVGHSDGMWHNIGLPMYDLPSFVRHLDTYGVSWRWYSQGISTLRLMDGRFRIGHRDKFFHFNRRTLSQAENFLDHAAAGNLAAVSWIDPCFGYLTGRQNDDHPPSDIIYGQRLVLELYNAIVHSPVWFKTMLIIVYDEHGGFYDHVNPWTAVPDVADDRPEFRCYGPRVPAWVVSPWSERAKVSHTVYDHASILKTILKRFCRQSGQLPDMGARVGAANDLGGILTLTTPRSPTALSAYAHLIDRIAVRRREDFEHAMAMVAARQPLKPQEPDALQQELVSAWQELVRRGLPADQP